MMLFQGRYLLLKYISESPCEKFSDLRISYLSVIKDTEQRKKSLREQYYFDCTCEACTIDPDRVNDLKLACVRCPACQEAIPVERSFQTASCRICQETMDAKKLKSFWDMKDNVEKYVFNNANMHPEPMEQCLEYVEDMRETFHPFDKTYLDVLESCYERQVASESWNEALASGRDLLIAYGRMYPKYDVNTALLLLKMAKMSNLVGWLKEAEEYVLRSKKILEVTHGAKHNLWKLEMEPLLTSVRLEMMEKEKMRLELEEDGGQVNGVKTNGV